MCGKTLSAHRYLVVQPSQSITCSLESLHLKKQVLLSRWAWAAPKVRSMSFRELLAKSNSLDQWLRQCIGRIEICQASTLKSWMRCRTFKSMPLVARSTAKFNACSVHHPLTVQARLRIRFRLSQRLRVLIKRSKTAPRPRCRAQKIRRLPNSTGPRPADSVIVQRLAMHVGTSAAASDLLGLFSWTKMVKREFSSQS